MICPLCSDSSPELYYEDRLRIYYQCRECSLVFVPPEYLPVPEKEKERYEHHNNNAADPGYIKFLERLYLPLKERIVPGASGLDYGCGPEPVLSGMFRKAGFNMTEYDYFFCPDPSFREGEYDFIAVCETAEHFHHPGKEFRLIWSLLKATGWLGVMTDRDFNRKKFSGWYYKEDSTHVCFYSDETFRYLGRLWGSDPVFLSGNTVLFRKRGSSLVRV